VARPQWIDRAGRGTILAGRAAWRGIFEFFDSHNLTFAASIAYYTLLSLFPFLLLVVTILSRLFVSGEATERNLVSILSDAVPPQLDFVFVQVRALAAEPLNLSLAGTLVALWGAMGVFGAVTSAVNHAWGVERSPGFLRKRLISLVMMLAAGSLAVIALLLMSFTEVTEAGWYVGLLDELPALSPVARTLIDNASMLIFIGVAGLIYYYVPNTPVRLRDVWFGAGLSGVLWRLAFEGFVWYLRDLSRFSVHGSVTAVVVFLLWVYLSAVILLYGVEVTAAYARLRATMAAEAGRSG